MNIKQENLIKRGYMKQKIHQNRVACNRAAFNFAFCTTIVSVMVLIFVHVDVLKGLPLMLIATLSAWFWGKQLGRELCHKEHRMNVFMVGLVVPFLTVVTSATVMVMLQIMLGQLAFSPKDIFNNLVVYIMAPYVLFGWIIIPLGIWLSNKLSTTLQREQIPQPLRSVD
ncbi:MAG: hypothetical protein BMS9Abin11_0317 [Gammaproteobacteria bacterium]|nr:MAG: hypothetical protein BMS9Abin11_0317 [Gammaproteobacteria bacterium]